MAAVPTPEGMVYWASEVISSRSPAEIILAFSTSPEYSKSKALMIVG